MTGSEEDALPNLEERVNGAIHSDRRRIVSRFGGLSLGESTHLVDEVSLVERVQRQGRFPADGWRLFTARAQGDLTLPVWVDHVGSAGTRHAVGSLVACGVEPPFLHDLPQIKPPEAPPTRGD